MNEQVQSPYEVVIHLQCNVFSKRLEEQIRLATIVYKLDRLMEHQGRKDFHWSFETWNEAVSAANALEEFCKNPNLTLLKVDVCNGSDGKPVTYKDVALQELTFEEHSLQ